MLILLIYLNKYKQKNKFFSLSILVILIIFYFNFQNNVDSDIISSILMLKEYISDLGAEIGFGIFSLLLSFLGILISWKNKKDNYIVYFIIFILILFVGYTIEFLIFLDMILIYYAGLSLISLQDMKWDLKILKTYALLLVICGLLFSSVSYINRIINFPPNQEEILSLKWLALNSQKQQVILSYYINGHLIQEIAKRPVITDKIYYKFSRERIRINDSNQIFYSTNLKKTEDLLKKYNISYIWINSLMKNFLWIKENEGLLFLLKNSQKFKNIYNYKGIYIWEYQNKLG
jgi:hypothetical protein